MANSGYPKANADLGYEATTKKSSSSGEKQYGGWYDNPANGRNMRYWGTDANGNPIWTNGEEPTVDSGMIQKSDAMLEQELASQLIDLDVRLSNLQVSLTDQEKDMYLQKAMEQVKPYYEAKRAEIQAGIKEGKIRTAEDLLMTMREVAQESEVELSKLDATKAQTEEEFVNTLAEMTRQEGYDAETNRLNWMERIDTEKQKQVESDMLTSGIGKMEVDKLKQRQALEQGNIEGQYAAKQTALETDKKYDLERIALARKAQEQKRMRIVGSPTEEAATKTALAQTAGLDENNLISEVEMARRRAERGITPVYNSGALNDLNEEEKRAIESRKLALQDDELSVRKQTAYSEAARAKAEATKKYKALTGSANYLT